MACSDELVAVLEPRAGIEDALRTHARGCRTAAPAVASWPG